MIGDMIRDSRLAKGWTQRQLAEASGISLGYIKQLEQGNKPNPTVSTLEKLAGALDVPLDAFAGQPPPPLEFPAPELQAAGLSEEEISQLRQQWDDMPAPMRRGYRGLLLKRAALEAELRELKRRGGDLKSLVVI